jgi:dinuclear metal center YbgI/SA1388 family protein
MPATKIKDVVRYLESIAPPSYQEGYDNAGLITGNPDQEVTGILCCLDSTEAIVEEARQKNCNLIVAHHPIVFKGLKRLTGRTYVERTIIQSIRHDIAIYAIHTNLDNVFANGVNERIGQTLGLTNTRILAPKQNLIRLVSRIPAADADHLPEQLAKHQLAHLQPRWSMEGNWTSISVEFRCATAEKGRLIQALEAASSQPVETASWAIQEPDPVMGSGLIGELPKALSGKEFLKQVAQKMQTDCIRHTAIRSSKIKTVALCGGAGGFLLPTAIRAGADAFITSDYKYHEFFDADGQILLADIGHYESEQFTIPLLQELLSDNFSNFAVYCTSERTNPVQYLVR